MRFHRRHLTLGHLFKRPYDSRPILTEEHLHRACGYTLRNPVRHGFVERAEEWEWSSFRASARLAPPARAHLAVRGVRPDCSGSRVTGSRSRLCAHTSERQSCDGDDHGVNVLIEGFGPDAIALARFLAAEGAGVRLAGAWTPSPPTPRCPPASASSSNRAPISTTDPGAADVAYLDPWTPETAPRVARLRAQGTRVSCLGDLLLERWRRHEHRHHGHGREDDDDGAHRRDPARGRHRRRREPRRPGGQPLADRRPARPALPEPSDPHVLLLELTSSHLAFMDGSPTIAAVISFWPDHLELHGEPRPLPGRQGDDRPAPGRRRPRRRQRRRRSRRASRRSLPRALVEFSSCGRVENGAYLDSDERLVDRPATGEETVARPTTQRRAPHPANVVAAAAIASPPAPTPPRSTQGIRTATHAAWRAHAGGHARRRPRDRRRDGRDAVEGRRAAAIASRSERRPRRRRAEPRRRRPRPCGARGAALLERACDEIARAASSWSSSARRHRASCSSSSVATSRRSRSATSTRRSRRPRGRRRAGARTVVFSPLFPVSLEDRARFQALVASHG